MRPETIMTELAFRSATALGKAIRTREIGCRELLEHFLARVERHNPALNAIIVTDLGAARRRADAGMLRSPAARVGALCTACR
jgi:amidase